MKRVIPFILSVIILSQSMNVSANDMVKLDDFFEHAQYHYEEFGDDIFTFVSKHYGNLKEEHSANHKNESSQHEQLPFNHHLGSHTSTIFLADFIEKEQIPAPIGSLHSIKFFYLLPVTSVTSADIFQPPKIA